MQGKKTQTRLSTNSLFSIFHLFPSLSSLEPPSAPTGLKVVATDSGKVTLSWESPSNDGGSPVTGYILQAASPKGQHYEDVGHVDGNITEHELSDLKKDDEYLFRVKAENPAGISKDSAQLDKPVKASPQCSKCVVKVCP